MQSAKFALNLAVPAAVPHVFNGSRFDPHGYLANYYPTLDTTSDLALPNQQSAILGSVAEENQSLLRFYAAHALPLVQNLPKPLKLLEVGGGPTIYQLISLAPEIASIHFTDYLETNLNAVRHWIFSADSYWQSYIRAALTFEYGFVPGYDTILERESEIKQKLTCLSRYDVIHDTSEEPIVHDESFDIACSNFCLESITNNELVWKIGFAHLTNKIKPGGLLFMTALKQANRYRVGEESFHALPITDSIVTHMLQSLGFGNITISTLDCSAHNHYQGIMYISAKKLSQGEGQ